MWESFIAAVESGNRVLNGIVWSIPMLVLIIGAGVFFTVRTGFFQLTRFKAISRETFFSIFRKSTVTKNTEKHSISQFQALSTALAATIGTGNIAGVATAITVGGPGAIFWMWVSAFFGMMTNYSENVLGIFYRKKNRDGEWSGGAMYYIENGFKDKKGLRVIAKPMAIVFSVFCVLASFGIGNMAQINSIADVLNNSFSVPHLATGVILASISGFVIVGGIRMIAKVSERLVPFMAIYYIMATLIIFFVNITKVPVVFGQIFAGAFGFDAVAGGISGALLKEAVTMGFKRSVFSNEAGLGSSVMVHSVSNVKEPVRQGMWGVFEVLFDTLIVCTLTAFAVLSTGVVGKTNANGELLEGIPLVSEAFATVFHQAAGVILSIAILLFALSTVLGWSYYGSKALEYLFGTTATVYYKIIFVGMIVVGATMNLQLVWDISDTLIGLMAIPNLIGVLVLSGTVIRITRNYTKRKLSPHPEKIEPMISAYPEIQKDQVAAMERIGED